MVHVEYAPLSRLLPHAAALVHHGGIGTTAQALRAGTPQLVFPFSYDQIDNGLRLRRLGVGDLWPPAESNPNKVATLLQKLLTDPSCAESCRTCSRRLATPTVDRAAAEIEALAQ